MGWLLKSMAMGVGRDHERRARRRKASLAVEDLEGRQLLAPVAQPFATLEASGLVAGKGGDFWAYVVQNVGQDSPVFIDRIGPDGSVTSSFRVPETDSVFDITSFAYGPDGNVWFTANYLTSYQAPFQALVGEMTPTGHFSFFPIVPSRASSESISDLVSGPGNALWFDFRMTDTRNRGQVFMGRVTTAGTITSFPVTPLSTHSPGITSLAPGPDGNLWFAELGTRKPLVRVTPTGVVTAFRVPASIVGEFPTVANGPNGSLILTGQSSHRQNTVFSVSPSGALSPYNIPRAINPAFWTYLGAADGSLWFTPAPGGKGTLELGRIMPNGSAVAYNLPSSDPGAYNVLISLAAGSDGNLYVLDSPQASPNSIVYRIVPGEL